MAVDKETGGFYCNIADDQYANVPFSLSTNVIFHPVEDHVDSYLYLRPNRCWTTSHPLVNPDFPLQIPPNANFLGNKIIYGNPATWWSFSGTFEAFRADITMAVNSNDHSIIFITIQPIDLQNFGTYLIFQNFNATRPDPSTYGIPIGNCWDPTRNGPVTK